MNPNDLILPKHRDCTIHAETEIALMQIPVNDWTPVCVDGHRVIDGVQRVLVARKYNINYIPVTNLKAA